jgi:ubiquinone/menaquinone biosynthesis C-methylase UbiE
MFINSHYNRLFKDLNGCLLDLGSGNSWYYDEDKYEKVIFLDFAFNMLKTRVKKDNSIFLNADASYIPLKDNSVDLILINSCLHHLARRSLSESNDDLLLCLKECARVLCKDGRILIFESGIFEAVEKIYEFLFPALFIATKIFKKPMVRPLSRSTLLKLINQASLTIIKNERIIPDCRVALAGCLLGNNRFLLKPKFYPWKFYVYLLTK